MVDPQYREWVNQNYSQITQSPLEAAGRTAARAYIPGASFFMDPAQQGPSQEIDQRLLGAIPYIGPGLNAISSGRMTEARQGWMTQNKQPSFVDNLMASIGAGLRFAPGGGVSDVLKNIYSGVQGARGIADFMGFNLGNMASGAVGLGSRALYNQFVGGGRQPGDEGVPSSSPNSNWSPGLSERAGSVPSWQDNSWALNPALNPHGFNYGPPATTRPPQASANPFYNPDTGTLPSWAMGPQSRGVPSTMTESPFYNPDTGTVPAWAQ